MQRITSIFLIIFMLSTLLITSSGKGITVCADETIPISEQEMLNHINSISTRSEMQHAIMLSFNILKLDSSNFSALNASEKDAVASAMVGKEFSSVAQYVDVLYYEIGIVKNHSTTGNSGSPSGGGGGGGGSRVWRPTQAGYYPYGASASSSVSESDQALYTTISGTIYFEETFDVDISVWIQYGYDDTYVTLLSGTNSVPYEFNIHGVGSVYISATPKGLDGYHMNWYCLNGSEIRIMELDGSIISDADIFVNKPYKISGSFYLPENFWETVSDDSVDVAVFTQACSYPNYDLCNSGRTLYRDNNETVFPFEFYLSNFNVDEFVIFYSILYKDYSENAGISPYGYYKSNGETGLNLDDSVKLSAMSYENIDFYTAEFGYSDEWGISLVPNPNSGYPVIVEVAQKSTNSQPTLIFASYVNGRLFNINKCIINTKAVRYDFYPDYLNNPPWSTDEEMENAVCQVKVFLWDNTAGMIPLCDSISIDY